MIVAVTGGRHYTRMDRVFRALDFIHARERITRIVTGACRDKDGNFQGADRWAMQWAACREIVFIGYPALFLSYGKAGGPIRNSHMLRNEGARYVVWFPGGSGTASAKQCAVTQSILLIEGEAL